MLRSLRVVLAAFVLIGIGFLGGHALERTFGWGPAPDTYDKLRAAIEIADRQYVDSLGVDALSQEALRGLFSGLDPHSSYIDRERMQRVRESFDAEFDGIGVTYERIGRADVPDTVMVVSVVPDGPSDKAGLRAGDRLVAVDETSLVGLPDERVQALLKGPRGTTVHVSVHRPHQPTPLTLSITRDRIPLNTVDATYMIDERTGYIKLNRFARTTHTEVRDALESLTEQGMERLVLDLRGNAGGLMNMAERVADEFLLSGQLVVSARGRGGAILDEYRTSRSGAFENGPMMVLVDRHSASASEIVAGALQDHQRALMIGERTYGKGLVQRQYDLGDGSGVRLTVARFYTPSGRVIQQPYDTGSAVMRTIANGADTSNADDAPGGISPDHRIESDTLYQVAQRFAQHLAVRDYMRSWIDRHTSSLENAWKGRPEAFLETYTVPDSVVTRLGADLRSASTRRAEQAVRDYDHLTDTVRGTILLRNSLTGMIARRVFGIEGWIRVENRMDPAMQATHHLWNHATDRAQAYAHRF